MEHRETPLERAARVLGFAPDRFSAASVVKVTEFVLEKFDVPQLGDELAALALCDIVLNVPFSGEEREMEGRLKERAAGLLTEILGVHARRQFTLPDVADIQQAIAVLGKTPDEVREIFNPSAAP